MKKFSSLLTLISLFFTYNVFAQDWVGMMQDHNANLKDVQAAFNKWYSTHQPTADKDAQKGEENETDGNYTLFKRWEAIMIPRTYPTGLRPDPAVIAKDYQDFLRNQNTRRSTHGVMGTSARWAYSGNTTIPAGGGDAGRVNRIRFNPTNTKIVYACAPSGGLWKSTNGGTSWSTNTDQLLGIGTSDVAIDPSNTNIMYLATGDGDGIGGGFTTPSTIGVLKSTDGGVTWNATSLQYFLSTSGPSQMTVNQLAINPTDTKIIFAATSFGLFYSPNAAATWFNVQSGNFKSVEFEPSHPSNVYAATANGAFYRSTNGGISFTSVVLPTSSGVGRLQIAVTPADSNYVYVVGDNASNNAFFGLWLSTNDGKTFTLQSTTPNVLGFGSGTGGDATQGQGWYTLSLAASPTTATTVFVGGVNIWESTNAGKNWSKKTSWTSSPYVHADIHHIAFVPGSGSTIYTGCDGGVYESTNSGAGWSDVGHNLEIAELYGIGISGSNAGEWITGWQDNGTNLSNAGWSQVLGGDGMICFIDNTNNNYMYGETYNGGFNGSTDGGLTWNGITNGITENGAWATPWLQDPKAPATLFAGLNNVWKSTNRGGSWTKISTFGNSGTQINYVAVAPSNDQYIYASIMNGIYATTNGGGTWTNITGSLPTGAAAISSIAVDPANPSRLWVTFSGYSGGTKVYQTSDGGTTWISISNGLPNLPVNIIAYQGGGNDAMYVGTDMGVFYRDTTITGGNWVDYSAGLPNVEVSDLKIYAPGNLLDASTYGRGTWQIPLYIAASSAPVANFSAFPMSICGGSSIQFTDTSSNEPTSWSWTFAGGSPATSTSQNPLVNYTAAGTYLVTMVAKNGIGQDSIGKTGYVTVFPVPATPTITQITGTDTLVCSPATFASYQWFKLNTALAGATASKYVVSTTGIYKVYATDSNGCTVIGQKVVSVLGVNEISLSNYIKVYPNPASGEVSVLFDMPEAGEYTIGLMDVLGQTIYTNKVQISGQYTQQINLAGYSKGVYFLSVTGKDSRGVQKILVY